MKKLILSLAVWCGLAGAAAAQVNCTQAATASGTTIFQVIAAPAAGTSRIYVCGYTVSAAAASAITFSYGTGAACVGGTTAIGPTIQLAATSTFSDTSPFFRGFFVPASQGLCATASTAASVTIYYVQQ